MEPAVVKPTCKLLQRDGFIWLIAMHWDSRIDGFARLRVAPASRNQAGS